jgi:predicted adenine nucleotide alpha hydrolase (AANH) superfamily ATPase
MDKRKKPRLLLSACCGPCSAAALERLTPVYDITVLFYGNNIDTADEFSRRFGALSTVNAFLNNNKRMILIDYCHDDFIRETANLQNEPEGGKRCTRCFELRLRATAKTAKLHGFELFATTLTASPYKDAELINKIGASIAAEYDVKYLPTDFKQNGGNARSAELSKQMGIYRQNYCGCKK